MANTSGDANLSLTVAVISKELERLHNDLEMGNGDDDETQSQIRDLQSEIIRITRSLVGA